LHLLGLYCSVVVLYVGHGRIIGLQSVFFGLLCGVRGCRQRLCIVRGHLLGEERYCLI
jgi:hypothetical protein